MAEQRVHVLDAGPPAGIPKISEREMRAAVEYDILKRLRKLERKYEAQAEEMRELQQQVQALEDETWDSEMEDDS